MNLTPDDQSRPEPEIVALVQRVLDHEASLDDVARINALLPRDPEARRYFVKMRLLHAALEDEFGAASNELDSIEGRSSAAPPGGIARFPARKPGRAMPPAARRHRRWAAAAAVALLASLAAFWGGRRILLPVQRPVDRRHETLRKNTAPGRFVRNRMGRIQFLQRRRRPVARRGAVPHPPVRLRMGKKIRRPPPICRRPRPAIRTLRHRHPAPQHGRMARRNRRQVLPPHPAAEFR